MKKSKHLYKSFVPETYIIATTQFIGFLSFEMRRDLFGDFTEQTFIAIPFNYFSFAQQRLDALLKKLS